MFVDMNSLIFQHAENENMPFKIKMNGTKADKHRRTEVSLDSPLCYEPLIYLLLQTQYIHGVLIHFFTVQSFINGPKRFVAASFITLHYFSRTSAQMKPHSYGSDECEGRCWCASVHVCLDK